MFKSKHSGWTWELRRTPFGGGGSWTNQVSNDISGVLGTDGSGGGIIGNTQNIINSASSGNPLDVTSAILGTDGKGLGALGALAQVDNSVHTLIPGGWATVAAIAATIASAGAASETLAATTGGEAAAGTTAAAAGGGAAAGSDAAFMAYDASNLAAQGLSQEAIAQNLATSYGISAADAQSLAAASADAYATSGAAPEGFSTTPTPTTGGITAFNPSAGTVGFNAASPSGIMATQSAAGLGGAGTGIIEGLTPTSVGMGGTAGAGSLAGITGSEAAAGLGGANLGYGLTAEQLAQYEAANPSANPANLSKLTNLLKSGAGSGLANSLGQLAQGANPQGMALPNLVRGNQNPFTYTAQQPIQNAQPMDLSALSKLLKQG